MRQKKPLFINYTKFTVKGKPLTRDDIWAIMCKYEAKNLQDKEWRIVMNVVESMFLGEKK